jgi:hypothetical protein
VLRSFFLVSQEIACKRLVLLRSGASGTGSSNRVVSDGAPLQTN